MIDARNPPSPPEKLPSPAETPGREPAKPADPPEESAACWVCGGPVIEHHCKVICQVCGFTRDCGDP